MTDSQPEGFLSLPSTGKGPGVLVLHAWWGLNDTVKALCTRLAEAGFVAFAPDLYHGKVAKTIPEAEVLGSAVDTNHVQAEAEVVEAATFLHEQVGQVDRGLAVVALSLGGFYALQLADAHPELIRSIVLFYGTDGGFAGELSNSRADYLGHFAEKDQYEPPSNADSLKERLQNAGCSVTFYQYPGAQHWFFEPDRPEYNQAAASLAWDRTLDFLKGAAGL